MFSKFSPTIPTISSRFHKIRRKIVEFSKNQTIKNYFYPKKNWFWTIVFYAICSKEIESQIFTIWEGSPKVPHQISLDRIDCLEKPSRITPWKDIIVLLLRFENHLFITVLGKGWTGSWLIETKTRINFDIWNKKSENIIFIG